MESVASQRQFASHLSTAATAGRAWGFFDDLGRSILTAWRRKDYNVEDFSSLALDFLTERPPARYVDYGELIRSVAELDYLDALQDLSSSFGEPPLTLFSSPPFYIEALFWRSGNTAIHDHGFAGGFSVLTGSTLQTTYTFERHKSINDRLHVGLLNSTSTRVLASGDAQPIVAGDRFVHSAFHVASPTVTIVVRTPPFQTAGRQLEYLRPFVARDPFHRDLSTLT